MRLKQFFDNILQFFEDLSQFQFVNNFKAFLCSGINILIYLLLAVFIISFAQGKVLPIDMYTNVHDLQSLVNIIVFHFLMYFLGLIMSLYPTYFYTFFFEEKTDKSFKSSPTGLIYYVKKGQKECKTVKDFPLDNDPDMELHTLKFLESSVRKFFGILIFMVWSWILVYIYFDINFEKNLRYILVVLNSIFTIFIGYGFWFFTIKVARDLAHGKQAKKYIKRSQDYYKWYPLILSIGLVFLIAITYFYSWDLITIIAQLIICLLFSFHILIYRTFRKFFDPICKIVNYLAIQRAMGIAVLIIIILVNSDASIAGYVNPINILLASLIAVYTIIVITFKIYLYLRYPVKKIITTKKLRFGLRSFALVLITLSLFTIGNFFKGNDLHKLNLVPSSKESEITIEEFHKNYISKGSQLHQPIIYSAYGGGLKAHLWNYLILEHLYQEDQFNRILAMSGVSGGGMGISNFAASLYLEKNSNERVIIKDKVKSLNILSIELSWLFGWELIRSIIPSFPGKSYDRSSRSMSQYSKILDKKEILDNIAFREVYNDLNKKGYYPNIIVNSTSVNNYYGVVSAINNEFLFPGSIDLLNINSADTLKTLTFFEAVSTCNRFPVISPAANIQGKGHFLDGGYFENSGIMSLISFKKGLQRIDGENLERGDSSNIIFKDKTVLVSIRNGKYNYLQSLLLYSNKYDANQIASNDLISNKDYLEIEAILMGISNLDRMPNYIKSMLKEYYSNEYDFIDIDLPFYINPKEIEKLFGGKINPELLAEIVSLVKNSNSEIRQILDDDIRYDLDSWGVINPPTARLLSEPVEIYIEAMMDHTLVKRNLNLISKQE